MLDPIVIGCDWHAVVTATPTDGETTMDVITQLTGASVSAKLVTYDGTVLLTVASAVVSDAAEREITLTLTDVETATLTARKALWDIRVTTASSLVYPLRMPPQDVLAVP